MKRSEIYREAARRISLGVNGLQSCLVVADVEAGSEDRAYFFTYPSVCCYAETFDFYGEVPGLTRDLRVLALCFMAAIAEAEEAPSKVTRAKRSTPAKVAQRKR